MCNTYPNSQTAATMTPHRVLAIFVLASAALCYGLLSLDRQMSGRERREEARSGKDSIICDRAIMPLPPCSRIVCCSRQVPCYAVYPYYSLSCKL